MSVLLELAPGGSGSGLVCPGAMRRQWRNTAADEGAKLAALYAISAFVG